MNTAISRSVGAPGKWFNSPTVLHEGSIAEVRTRIPDVTRRSFGITQRPGHASRLNPRLDLIMRLPTDEDADEVPLGVVSKAYTLISHKDVMDMATHALAAAGIDLGQTRASMYLTELGERMDLSIFLPAEHSFDAGDGSPMALRLECQNSVDGSTRFRVLMGWFRFVCSNGLVVGVTQSDIRRRHRGDAGLEDIGKVLSAGLVAADADRSRMRDWQHQPLRLERLHGWTEEILGGRWGVKAAARVFHVATRGIDVELKGMRKGDTPTTVRVRDVTRVPGTHGAARNVYELSQALAWVACSRRDLQERLAWKEDIPDLMRAIAS